MLNKDFLKWVVVSFVIACPLAWYAMHRWLENFAYRMELSWWIFVLAACLTMIIALIAVNWQTIRVARKNPTETLRSE
jgi:putative ABC transport system permease protein